MSLEKPLYSDVMDGVDALIEIEEVFGLSIPDEASQHMENVGHLYDYIVDRMPEKCGEKCSTSVSFYQLRRDLNAIRPNLNLNPKTLLHNISINTPRAFWKELSAASSLNLPSLENTKLGKLAISIGLLSACGLALILFIKPTASVISILIFIILLSIILTKIDPMRFPKKIQSLADLATETSQLNYGQFVKKGARVNENEHWNRLIFVLSEWSDAVETKHISRQTRFY